MITNVPTPEDLNRAALRLYFSAWTSLMQIISDFDQTYADVGDWTNERKEYLQRCQSELQANCTLIQQSNELALKAKIAGVSPYLLLFRNDRKFSRIPRDVDFSDLRTLDANDLPGAVNSFCSPPLTDSFVSDYEKVRSLRNKITHLGSAKQRFDPEELLKLMTKQYIELWPDRGWLAERYRFSVDSRYAFFHDGKYSSAEGEVFEFLDETLARFTKSEFRKLFGYNKSARRYLCHECLYQSDVGRAGLDVSTCRTAFLNEDAKGVHCVMCDRTWPISRKHCDIGDCKGNVVAETNDDFDGMCLTCGEYPSS